MQVVDSARVHRLYVDGVERAQATLPAGVISMPSVAVDIGHTGGNNHLIGQIDEARISSVARTSAEIAGYYKTSRPHGKLLWSSDPSGAGVNLAPTGCATGTRCGNITYAGAAGSLNYGSARFYTRTRFRTSTGNPTAWSGYDWFEIQDSLTVSLDTAPCRLAPPWSPGIRRASGAPSASQLTTTPGTC